MARTAGSSFTSFTSVVVLTAGLAILVGPAAARAAAQSDGSPGTLVALEVEDQDGRLVVRLVGSDALAATINEITTAPYRVFLDIANVVPDVPAVTDVNAGDLERVRVALNQPSPPVTRVVLDLEQPVVYWLERDPVNRELRVVIEPTPAPARPAANEADGYLIDLQDGRLEYTVWFSRAVAEIERLLAPAPATPVDVLQARWRSLHRALDAVTPPLSHKVAHSLLVTATQLGRAALDASETTGPPVDAESARAGATMLVSRAREINEAQIARAAAQP